MSASLKTQNYELPIFVADDIPAWLVDWNNAMTAIDTAIASAKQSGDDAKSDVANMQENVTQLQQSILNLSNSVTNLTASITDIQNNLTNKEILLTDASYSRLFSNGIISVFKADCYQTDSKIITVDGVSASFLGTAVGNIYGLNAGTKNNDAYSGGSKMTLGTIMETTGNRYPFLSCGFDGTYTYFFTPSFQITQGENVRGTCVVLNTGNIWAPPTNL